MHDISNLLFAFLFYIFIEWQKLLNLEKNENLQNMSSNRWIKASDKQITNINPTFI